MQHEIRVISLDLDDTLWPCMEVIHAAEQGVFVWLQRRAPDLTAMHDLGSLRQHRLATAADTPAIAHDLTEVRRLSLARLMRRLGIDEHLAEGASAEFRRLRNQVQPYPEVRPALHRLRSRFTLISVTNGNAQVEHTPLHDCFHYCVNAADVGSAKPHPAMFARVCDLTAASPNQILHVGDDPHRDIVPARAFGMRTAWINRDTRDWPRELTRADLEIRDLDQLLSILAPP